MRGTRRPSQPTLQQVKVSSRLRPHFVKSWALPAQVVPVRDLSGVMTPRTWRLSTISEDFLVNCLAVGSTCQHGRNMVVTLTKLPGSFFVPQWNILHLSFPKLSAVSALFIEESLPSSTTPRFSDLMKNQIFLIIKPFTSGQGAGCWRWCCELAARVVETGCRWCWVLGAGCPCWCYELAAHVLETGRWWVLAVRV